MLGCKVCPSRRDIRAFFCVVSDQISPWFPIRTRDVKKFLKKLRSDQATGPDHISSEVLRRLADVIALPMAIPIRRIFAEGCWPERWRLHHICPLFKKGSVYMPGQYRGIHLTSILSKTVERVIGEPLVKFLADRGYGNEQWAFRKKSSGRDLVTVYVAKWTLLICQGRRVGLYLADISGVFDKVSRCLLIRKMSQLEMPSSSMDFLNSYLQSCEG